MIGIGEGLVHLASANANTTSECNVSQKVHVKPHMP